ncbi:MAG: GAF domain-containing protein [Chloroflexi bacterium]|nr:GAF domain-containing protein [Chloroflexota bacterium]
MNNLFRLPENTSSQTRNAWRIALIGLPASIIAASFYLYLALTIGAWQLYVWSADIWLLAVAIVVAMVFIRRDRMSWGVWILLAAIQVTFIGAVALIEGIGLLVGVSIAILVSIIAGQTLSSRAATRASVLGMASGVAAFLLDLFGPAYRFPQPEPIRVFLPFILGGVILLYAYQTIRQFRNFSLQTKLIVSFVLVTIVTAGSIVFFVDRSSRTALTNAVGNNLSIISAGQANAVGQTLVNELGLLNTLALSQAVQQRAFAGTIGDNLSQTEINTLDQEWKNADAANNNSDPLVARVLSDPLSAELLKFQAKYPENVEVFLTDLPGVSIATTDRTSDYLQSDEDWWQAAYKNGEYIGQPEFDASSKVLSMNMAVAVKSPYSNQVVGVLRTTVNINALGNVLSAGLFGKTGQTSIFLPDGQQIKLVPTDSGKYELTVEKAGTDITALLGTSEKYQVAPLDNVPSVVSMASVSTPGSSEESKFIKNLGWYVVTQEDQEEAFQPITAQTQNNLILAVVITVLASLAAIGLAQILSRPLVRLATVAEQVAAGDLEAQAKVESTDEIGVLSQTFNNMTSRLRDLIVSLEERVAARTKDLATVASISTTIATIRDPLQMLATAVHLTQRGFGLYHAHVFTFQREGKDLQIVACGWKEGDVHEGTHGTTSIPIAQEQSLVARAARTRKPVIINDVLNDPDWLPNPLLPETRAELAVPMIVGDELLGVLDVQADHVDAFSDQDANIQMTLASQIATALQSAQAYIETKTKADLEEMVNTIGQKIQRTASVGDALQTAIREVGLALGAPRVSASITRHPSGDNDIRQN